MARAVKARAAKGAKTVSRKTARKRSSTAARRAGIPPDIPVQFGRSVTAFTEGAFKEVTRPDWLKKMPYLGLQDRLKTDGYEILSVNANEHDLILSCHVASGMIVAWMLFELTATPVLLLTEKDLVQFSLSCRQNWHDAAAGIMEDFVERLGNELRDIFAPKMGS